ncbi:response regulator transcription factor [Marinobacterium jannaschii]|uniref:response regulator transcription factor n=1 Tax=Marinobacterium jannaschii TaxID=64970 RepID=UPI000484EF2B|nr:response regulator transcription factor [Marinobacterium jannaschii]
MSHEIRILLADDHPMVREGLRASLDGEEGISVVAAASDGQQALELAASVAPDVVLLDISMPGMNGLEAALRFRQEFPGIRVLVLTMHEDREYILKMVQSGVAGYVLKDVAADELILAVQTVYQGGTFFSSAASRILFSQFDAVTAPAASPQDGLTAREKWVLRLLAEGCGNKDIAREMEISVRTAEAYRQKIKQKLNISTSAGLIRYAIDQKLVKS